MKYLSHLAVSSLLVGTATAQSPDSTSINISVGNGASVPTTTIIPIAEPPIKEIDTTYIHVAPPDSVLHRHKREHCKRPHRDSLRCHNTKRSLSNPER